MTVLSVINPVVIKVGVALKVNDTIREILEMSGFDRILNIE